MSSCASRSVDDPSHPMWQRHLLCLLAGAFTWARVAGAVYDAHAQGFMASPTAAGPSGVLGRGRAQAHRGALPPSCMHLDAVIVLVTLPPTAGACSDLSR